MSALGLIPDAPPTAEERIIDALNRIADELAGQRAELRRLTDEVADVADNGLLVI